jgi:hypothetical protein
METEPNSIICWRIDFIPQQLLSNLPALPAAGAWCGPTNFRSLWIILQQAADGRKQRWNVAFYDTPDDLRVNAIVIVDKDIARGDHLPPRNLGIRSPKLTADLTRRFPNDFQVPANSIGQERFGHATLPAKFAALNNLMTAIANVLKVCP